MNKPSAHTQSVSTPGSVVHPAPNDVLLGRGMLHASHPGNVRFYEIIDAYLPLYDAAKSRSEKTRLVQIMYEEITSVGRFVKDDAASAACRVIATTAAKKKISHAIRFRRQVKKKRSSVAAGATSDTARNHHHRRSMNSPAVAPKEALQPQKNQPRVAPRACGPPPAHNGTIRAETSDCIFADGELESVLLPPDHLAAAVSYMAYEDLILGESMEDCQPGPLHSKQPDSAGSGPQQIIKKALEITTSFDEERHQFNMP